MAFKYPDSLKKLEGLLRTSGESPKGLTLSNKFFRDYTCPQGCGGCCSKFSLDYFEGERWETFKTLYPEQQARFKKRIYKGVTVYTDFQEDNGTRFCRNLNLTDGRCKIHQANPLSCEFELIKLMPSKGPAFLTKKLFARGWKMMRVDGNRGAKCEMIPFAPHKIKRDIHLVEEMAEVASRMGIATKLGKVAKFLTKHLDKLQKGLIPKESITF